jgi:hypothetical protein
MGVEPQDGIEYAAATGAAHSQPILWDLRRPLRRPRPPGGCTPRAPRTRARDSPAAALRRFRLRLGFTLAEAVIFGLLSVGTFARVGGGVEPARWG